MPLPPSERSFVGLWCHRARSASPDASRLVGTDLANALIPLYESPTIRPKARRRCHNGVSAGFYVETIQMR